MPALIFLYTLAKIPGVGDRGYSDSPDPPDNISGQLLTFLIDGFRRRSGYGNGYPLSGDRRKQAGPVQSQICPVNLASIDTRLLFYFANRGQNIASFEHSHRDRELDLLLNLFNGRDRTILFDLEFHSIHSCL
jgi:hypothetical protein